MPNRHWCLFLMSAVLLLGANAAVARPPLQPISLKLIGNECLRGGKLDFLVETQLHAKHDAATLGKQARLLLLTDGGSLTVTADGGPRIVPAQTDGSDIPLGDFKSYAKADLASGDLASFLGRPIRVTLDVEEMPQRVVVFLIVEDEGVFWKILDRCDQVPGAPSNNLLVPVKIQRHEGVSASAAGSFSITATVTYIDNLGVSRPMPNVPVELWDYDVFSSNDLLASGTANSQGVVTFSNIVNTGDEAGGQDIYFVIRAARTGVVLVTTDGASTYTWTTNRTDNLADGTWSTTISMNATQNSGAANLYDAVNKAYNYITLYASPAPPTVVLVWPSDGTYYQGGKIHIESGEEWAESTAIHEYAHHLDWNYAGGFVPDYGGSNVHYIDGHYSDGTAWGEGWPDFFQSPVRQYYGYANPDLYIWGSGASRSLESGAVNSGADTDVELNVAAAMWDVFDSNSDAGDALSDGFSRIWAVFDAGTGTDTIYTFWDVWSARGYGSLPQVADIFYQQGCYAAVDDPTSPAVTITGPTSASTYTSSNSSITISGSASDNLRVSSLQWANDRGGSGSVAGATSWSIPSIALKSGLNNITVKAFDRKGNSSIDAIAVTYSTADTTAPVVTITTPVSNGSYSTSSSSVSLAGGASDAVGVTSVTWSNDRGGSGTASGTSTWSASNIALFSGTNIITVSAFDAAGNRGQAQIVVTNTAPCSISAIPQPSVPSSVNSGSSYSLSWTATSPDNSYDVQESVDPSFNSATTSSVTGTSKSFSHTVQAVTVYYYRVRAKLSCGAVSNYSSSVQTTVSSTCTAPATPVLTAPTSAAGGSSYEVTWTGTSAEGYYRLEESRDSSFSQIIFSSKGSIDTHQAFVHSSASTATYYYRVQAAHHCSGNEIWSDYSTVRSTVVAGTGATYGDFGGDGRADLFWRHSLTGDNYLWAMNGATVLASSAVTSIPDPQWRVAAAGLFYGAPRSALLFRHDLTGSVYMWQMNGATVAAATPVATVGDLQWQVSTAGDFNGDGYWDVFWRRSTGETYVWLMQGASLVSSVPSLTVADVNWKIVGSGDFNNDGRADLLWRRDGSGENYLWLMNGTMPSVATPLPSVPDANWRVRGIGDFDADGRADIFWFNAVTGDSYVWLMNGATPVSIAPVSKVTAGWQPVACADIDGDKRADIVWRRDGGGENYVWLMHGTSFSAVPLLTVSDSNWKVVAPK